MINNTVYLRHTPSNNEWHVRPACKTTQMYKDQMGRFCLPKDPMITVEYFRNAGYNVEIETPTLVFKYRAYEVKHAA